MSMTLLFPALGTEASFCSHSALEQNPDPSSLHMPGLSGPSVAML